MPLSPAKGYLKARRAMALAMEDLRVPNLKGITSNDIAEQARKYLYMSEAEFKEFCEQREAEKDLKDKTFLENLREISK